MEGNTIFVRIAAFYIIVMGVLTFIHALLGPLIYDQPMMGTPVLWDWMNPLNVVALIAAIWLSMTGFDGSRRPSMDSEMGPLTIAPIVVLLVYLLNWTAGLSDVDNPFLWVILDTAVLVLGVAIGVKSLRATGMEMSMSGMSMPMGMGSSDSSDDDGGDGDDSMAVATMGDDDSGDSGSDDTAASSDDSSDDSSDESSDDTADDSDSEAEAPKRPRTRRRRSSSSS